MPATRRRPEENLIKGFDGFGTANRTEAHSHLAIHAGELIFRGFQCGNERADHAFRSGWPGAYGGARAANGPQRGPPRASMIGAPPSLEVRMSNQLEIVEAQALKLTAEERAQLADRLITSLFEDYEIESAWAAEVERRIEEIESGRAKLIPAADSIARARAAIK